MNTHKIRRYYNKIVFIVSMVKTKPLWTLLLPERVAYVVECI